MLTYLAMISVLFEELFDIGEILTKEDRYSDKICYMKDKCCSVFLTLMGLVAIWNVLVNYRIDIFSNPSFGECSNGEVSG